MRFLFLLHFPKVSNTAVKDCNNYTDFTGKEFLDPAIDATVKATSKAHESGENEVTTTA